MPRTLKYDIPGDDPRRTPSEILEQGWEALFDAGPVRDAVKASGIVLEIGFGRGEFLLELAARSPHTPFVGIEVSFKRTLKMARKVARARLQNVRILEAAAEKVFCDLFLPGQLACVWVNFSDPWPKVRHGHRRVIQSPFVSQIADRLAPGGTLRVATDDVPYAHQIDAVLRAEPRLENCHAPWPFVPHVEGQVQTGYEIQWKAEGRPMHFFAYARRSVDP